jgi:hypothetical protein
MIGGVSYYYFEITPVLYSNAQSNYCFQKLSKITAYVYEFWKNYTKLQFRIFLRYYY